MKEIDDGLNCGNTGHRITDSGVPVLAGADVDNLAQCPGYRCQL